MKKKEILALIESRPERSRKKKASKEFSLNFARAFFHSYNPTEKEKREENSRQEAFDRYKNQSQNPEAYQKIVTIVPKNRPQHKFGQRIMKMFNASAHYFNSLK